MEICGFKVVKVDSHVAGTDETKEAAVRSSWFGLRVYNGMEQQGQCYYVKAE